MKIVSIVGIILSCCFWRLSYAMEIPKKPIEKPKIKVISEQKNWDLDQDVVFQSKTLAHQVNDVNQAYLPLSVSCESFDLLIPSLELVSKIKNNEAKIGELKENLKQLADNKLVTLATIADYADVPMLNQSCIQEIAERFSDNELISHLLKDKDSEYRALPQTLEYNVVDECSKKNRLLQNLFFAQRSQNAPLYKIDSVDSFAVHADTNRLATTKNEKNGPVYLWNFANGEYFHSLNKNKSCRKQYMHTIAINESGTALLAGNYNGTIDIWDLKYPWGQTVCDGTSEYSDRYFMKLGFFDNDAKFFCLDSKYDIRIWDRGGKLLNSWKHADQAVCREYSHAHTWLVTAHGSTLNLYNLLTQKHTQLTTQADTMIHFGHRRCQQVLSNVSVVQINPNGKQLAVGFGNGQIAHYDLTKPVIDGEYAFGVIDSSINAIAGNPVDNTIAAVGYNQNYNNSTIVLWDPKTNEKHCLSNAAEKINGLSFNATGNLLASSQDMQIEVWNVPLKQCVQTLITNSLIMKIHGAAVFVDDHRICATHDDGSFKLWKTHDPQRIKEIKNFTVPQLACLLYFLDAAQNKSPLEITDSLREILADLPGWAKDYIHYLLPVK